MDVVYSRVLPRSGTTITAGSDAAVFPAYGSRQDADNDRGLPMRVMETYFAAPKEVSRKEKWANLYFSFDFPAT